MFTFTTVAIIHCERQVGSFAICRQTSPRLAGEKATVGWTSTKSDCIRERLLGH